MNISSQSGKRTWKKALIGALIVNFLQLVIVPIGGLTYLFIFHFSPQKSTRVDYSDLGGLGILLFILIEILVLQIIAFFIGRKFLKKLGWGNPGVALVVSYIVGSMLLGRISASLYQQYQSMSHILIIGGVITVLGVLITSAILIIFYFKQSAEK